MTAQPTEGDHPEAITLGLHDASPAHLVDVMADDVVLELGWGRLIFGQTFADAEKLAEVLRGETHGRRDICIYAREPHVLVSPRRPPSCSSIRATPTGCASPRTTNRRRRRPASPCVRCRTPPKPTR